MSLSRVSAFIELARPWWFIVLLPVFIASAVLASDNFPSSYEFTFGLISFIFLKSGLSTLNDYFDRDVDQINNPKRPIPSKRVSPRIASTYAVALLFISILSAFLVNRIFLILVIIVIPSSILHFWKSKRIFAIPGISNIFTSLLLAFTPLLGWATISDLNLIAIMLFLIVFFYDMSHDSASAIRDIIGDSKKGVKTFASTLGSKSSSILCTLFFIITITVSLLLYLITKLGIIYLIGIIIGSIICFASIFSLLITTSYRKAKKTHILISSYPIIISIGIIMEVLI